MSHINLKDLGITLEEFSIYKKVSSVINAHIPPFNQDSVIDRLWLTVGLTNLLKGYGIDTLPKLLDVQPLELRNSIGIGKKRREELRLALAKYGVVLGEDLEYNLDQMSKFVGEFLEEPQASRLVVRLRKQGIISVALLSLFKYEELLEIPGISEVHVHLLSQALNTRGLTLYS